MEKRPLVSVIMGVYNGTATLGEAIRSILDQTYQNIEFIICDDASTDDTWEQLQSWAQRDSRISLIRNTHNLGAGGARNCCLERAQGSYIAIMDADDISMPSRLEQQIEVLMNGPNCSFVGTKGQFFAECPGDLQKCYWFVAKPEKRDFLMTLPFVHASLMFRAEVLWELGGYSRKCYVKRSEDYDLLMRAYAEGFYGINLLEPLYAIRLDRCTYQRRKYRYRFNECAVKWNGFAKLGLMPRGIPFALKPLLVGLMPVCLLNKLKEIYYGRQEKIL